MARRDSSNRSGTVALVGGAALALFLLARGKGWALGASDQHVGDTERGHAGAQTVVPGSRRVVWILAGDRIEIDGVAADLATVIARGREVEHVELHARGDARHGFVVSVANALHAAGLTLRVAQNLANLVPGKVLP